MCVYISDAWCRDTVVVSQHCSPLVEFMVLKCRPFYLPREFTAILVVAVYLPPNPSSEGKEEALGELYRAIFNHANLKTVQPKICQHVDFPTRGKKH